MKAVDQKEPEPTAESLIGRKNIYTCHSCGHHIVTEDTAAGVTPFMIPCEAFGCGQMMQSSMYRVFDQNIRPGYHWYAPTEPEKAALPPGYLDHVNKGGLLMRKADGTPTNVQRWSKAS